MTRRTVGTATDGETLLEVLITIMVTALGVVGILFGILSAATGSTASQAYADTREELAAAATRIQAADYQPASASGSCDTAPTNAYNAALAGITAPKTNGINAAAKPTILRIAYWNGSTFLRGTTNYTDPGGAGSVPGCYYDRNPGASHMQRITLKQGGDQLTILKRES